MFMTFYLMCFSSLPPEVTTISPSRGSIQGGTMLTISGRFFDQTDFPVRVLVGGIFMTFNTLCYKNRSWLSFNNL